VPPAALRRNFVEYFEMSLLRTVILGSAGTFGWAAAAVPEAAVTMPALRISFFEVSTTRPTEVSNPLILFLSFGNSIVPPFFRS
jgi:hypothetical protein